MKIIRNISTALLAVAVLGGPLVSMAGNQGKDSGRQPGIGKTAARPHPPFAGVL